MKLGKDVKWIIFKISDDGKEIVVEEASTDKDYNTFRDKLVNAKSKNKRGEECVGARYAVYDVEYDAPNDGGKRAKITFIAWVPDDAGLYVSDDTVGLMVDCIADTRAAAHVVLVFQGGPQALAHWTCGRHSSKRRRRHRARQHCGAGVQGPLDG